MLYYVKSIPVILSVKLNTCYTLSDNVEKENRPRCIISLSYGEVRNKPLGV